MHRDEWNKIAKSFKMHRIKPIFIFKKPLFNQWKFHTNKNFTIWNAIGFNPQWTNFSEVHFPRSKLRSLRKVSLYAFKRIQIMQEIHKVKLNDR